MWRGAMWVVVMLALSVGALTCFIQHTEPDVPAYLRGMGGDFTLRSAHGPVSLHDFRGKVGLLYFGYTHCPDACPMALSVIARALRGMSAAQRDRVYALFVSVDPKRDTPEHLQAYTAFFDRRIIGLTGTTRQLTALAVKYRMDFEVPQAPADAAYTVRHSRFIYLLDAEGRVVALFDEKTPSARLRRALRRWLYAASVRRMWKDTQGERR
ncbi:MAG: SCO family protein [Zetaproteobacteria bacterium]|nr:MAG: SCO family protein [Zetaproteobacteria bacterium]